MNDLGNQSIALHHTHHGKLAVHSKVNLVTDLDLSLAYTPGVGAVVKAIAENPAQARNLTMKRNMVAVVTDGSAILGLGNLGATAALPVMEGKAIIFKAMADVDAFPICLDTQDTEEIISTIKYIAPGFGAINLEDISAPRCFEIERRLQAELDIPVVHDDQHGTAIVVLAGLINAIKLRNLSMADAKIVVLGAGAAGTAIAKLLWANGFKNLLVCDSHGVINSARTDLNHEKQLLLELTTDNGLLTTLTEACRGANVLIGVSRAGLLTAAMVQSMAEQPIIFAMANPEPEIMPDIAKAAGAWIVATGRSDFPNQINNSLVFPGLFRGLLDAGIAHVTNEVFLAAAKALADFLPEPKIDQLLPSTLDRGVAQVIAQAVVGILGGD